MGWVLTASIDKTKQVRHSYRPLEISRFAGSATSINDVLPHLAETGFCFTVGRTGLEGFITPTDLDRHAARSHFYLLVSAVEMQLSAIVRSHVPEQDLVSRISDTPLHVAGDAEVETLRARYERAKSRGNETHAVEYLYLGELIDILERISLAGVDAALLAQLRAVRDLRPTVMHPTRSLAAQGAAQLASVAKAAVSAKGTLDGLLRPADAA